MVVQLALGKYTVIYWLLHRKFWDFQTYMFLVLLTLTGVGSLTNSFQSWPLKTMRLELLMKISAGAGGNVSSPWGCGKADALLGLKHPGEWSQWPRRFVRCLDFRCCHRVPEKVHWISKKSTILWVLLFKIYGSGYIFFNKFIFIYLFGCAKSWLWHVNSVAACGI